MASPETNNGNKKRWTQFSLRTLLIAFFVLGVLLVSAITTYRAWQSLYTESISVRLSSSGTIPWGERVVHVSEMHSHLESAVKECSSSGIKLQLIIECYTDTRESDVETMRAIAHDAGIDIVRTEHHSWPSPDWQRKQN